MNKKRLFIGLLVVGCLAVLNIYLLSTSTSQRADPQPPELSRPDGGLTHQRQRIDEVIDSVGEMEYADLVADLSTHSERYELAQAAGHSSPVSGLRLHKLRQVLADRRALKLFELLRAFPPDKQRTAPVELFQNKLELHRELTANVSVDNVWTLQANYHALHVALFLCAMYSDPDDFFKNCDEWIAEPDLGGPELLFLASLYAIILTEKGQMSEQVLRSKVEEIRESLRAPDFELPPLVTLDIYGSSAHTTDLDFLHRHGAVSADSSAVIKSVIGFDDWEHTGVMWEEDKTRAAGEAIRGWIR